MNSFGKQWKSENILLNTLTDLAVNNLLLEDENVRKIHIRKPRAILAWNPSLRSFQLSQNKTDKNRFIIFKE